MAQNIGWSESEMLGIVWSQLKPCPLNLPTFLDFQVAASSRFLSEKLEPAKIETKIVIVVMRSLEST